MKFQLQPCLSFAEYLFCRQASWYWITNGLILTTSISVSVFPQDVYPGGYLRAFFGLIFVLWLPGFAFIKALYPLNLPIKTSSEKLDSIERIALSIGMSIILTSIVGLILNYTPWGLELTAETLALALLTMILATAAIIKEYQTQKKQTSNIHL